MMRFKIVRVSIVRAEYGSLPVEILDRNIPEYILVRGSFIGIYDEEHFRSICKFGTILEYAVCVRNTIAFVRKLIKSSGTTPEYEAWPKFQHVSKKVPTPRTLDLLAFEE